MKKNIRRYNVCLNLIKYNLNDINRSKFILSVVIHLKAHLNGCE